jgi:hypothetical protein
LNIWVVALVSFVYGFGRLAGAVEVAEMPLLTFKSEISAPLQSALAPHNPTIAGSVIAPLVAVGVIHATTDGSEISGEVVERVAVDVVDVQAVRDGSEVVSEYDPVQLDNPAEAERRYPCSAADVVPLRAVEAPPDCHQHSSREIIVKDLCVPYDDAGSFAATANDGQMKDADGFATLVGSHDVSLSVEGVRCGQGRPGVSASSRPALFYERPSVLVGRLEWLRARFAE